MPLNLVSIERASIVGVNWKNINARQIYSDSKTMYLSYQKYLFLFTIKCMILLTCETTFKKHNVCILNVLRWIEDMLSQNGNTTIKIKIKRHKLVYMLLAIAMATSGSLNFILERFFSGTLESNSSDVTGLTLHAQTYIQKNATLV